VCASSTTASAKTQIKAVSKISMTMLQKNNFPNLFSSFQNSPLDVKFPRGTGAASNFNQSRQNVVKFPKLRRGERRCGVVDISRTHSSS